MIIKPPITENRPLVSFIIMRQFSSFFMFFLRKVFNLDSPRKEDTCQSRYRQWVIPNHFSWWEQKLENGANSHLNSENHPTNTDINLIIWTTTQSCKFQSKIKSVKTDWELSDRRKPGSRVLDPVALVAFRSDKEVSWAILAWSELRVFCIFHLAKRLLQVIFCESLTVFRVLENLHSVCTFCEEMISESESCLLLLLLQQHQHICMVWEKHQRRQKRRFE